IESLSGTVEVRTEKDKGSAFIIRLPLTLAIIQALLVIVGNEKYAIPLNNIKEITNIDTVDIRNIEDKEIILYRGVPLELKRMSEVLDCENQERKEGNVTVVIVRKGEKDLGLIIDSLIGQQEIVIKSLGPYLSFVKLIAGATILGNGGVALIIDTNEIF
ncbi:MAG: chemotaxis protein CheW, partial [Peptoanaerobacter stomatis]